MNGDKMDMKDKSYPNQIKYDINLLLCPFCYIKIPFISYEFLNDQVILHISCECIKEEKPLQLSKYLEIIIKASGHSNKCILSLHHNITASNYCGICQCWMCQECVTIHQLITNNHCIFNREIHMGCIEHKKPYMSYCLYCTKEICIDCEDDHVNHRQVNIQETKLNKALLNSLKQIKEVINKNNEMLNDYVSLIDSRINKLKNHKKAILASYQSNKTINDELEKFISIILSTSEVTKYNPSYAMHKLLETIHIIDTYPSIDYKTDSIDKVYEILKIHYDNNYIINIKETWYKSSTKSLNETTSESLNKSNTDSSINDSLIDSNRRSSQVTYNNITPLAGHNNTIKCLMQLSNGLLASASWDGTIKIWDVSSLQEIATMKGHTTYIWSIIQLADLNIMSCSDDSIIIWDHTTYQSIKTIEADSLRCIIQLKNGNICSSSGNKTITIWDMKTYSPKATVIGHTAVIWSVIQLKNHRIVSCSYDSIIKLWNSKLDNLGSFKGHSGSVNGVIQLKDKRLASCSDDKSIRLWNAKSLKQTNILLGHQDWIYSIVQLNNNNLVSSSHDRSIKFWCLSTYCCIDSIMCDCDTLSMLELSDEILVTGSGDWNGKGEEYMIKLYSNSLSKLNDSS